MNSNITQERAARRYSQIATLERTLQKVHSEINDCKAHLKELNDRRDGVLDRMRVAARDEGELPLFDLDGGDDD